MKIDSAEIRNYRMLKHLDIDFEDVLSLIIGKNNSGKTSFLSILQKFLSDTKPEFSFEDFSIDSQSDILALESSNLDASTYIPTAISLKLQISYTDSDNIGTASVLLMDLDDMVHRLVVLFKYSLSFEKYKKLLSDFSEQKAKGMPQTFIQFITKHINRYFSVDIKALEYGNEKNAKVINSDAIKSIISFEIIGAKRDVDNEQGRSKSLSILASKYYNSCVNSETEFPELQKQLSDTDENLSGIYKDLFQPIVKEIAAMSYNPKEAELSIISTLSEKKIFQDNTTVKYKHEDTLLPEDYNGLGYLNLFAMIFNIRIKLDRLSKKNKADESPTPINILFIEEPEAHTHPQMQYVFITNIKHLLLEQQGQVGNKFALQTIISTHSSHIVSQCDFKDIKYFYRETSSSVKSRSLKTLYSKMVTSTDNDIKALEERAYKFVKQYVTLNRAELFFADKAILIEGDTERMLISAMMKKHDGKEVSAKTEGYEPLLSQNISVIEVGAYSYNFATFLGFIGIKTLIITDLDCAKKGGNNHLIKCRFTEGTSTTNASIKSFTGLATLSDIIALAKTPVVFEFDSKSNTWGLAKDGNLRLLFQKEENGYQARSFEDAFLCVNKDFVTANKENFSGLKCVDSLDDNTLDYYDIADRCIDSKTTFALDLLLFDGENDLSWDTPLYIEEGLSWLAQ